MMLKIAQNLSLPLDFITERVAFLARTGSGKSGGMRVMFEQYLDAKQFVIFIDPKGDAWGIRAAGIGKGRPVLIMGGDYGDVPLEATAGKFIAEFLVRERVSTVLDVSDFSTAEMNRFVTDLATSLYRRNRDVVHIFIDEADMVAGEKFFDPKTLHAIQLIQNKGRHRGFGVTIATQRSAMINKSVLFASGTLIAMQTTGPNDIKTVRSWLEISGTPEATKEIIQALPTLKKREAFVYSPQTLGPDPVRIIFDEFKTFDSMRTPKPGEARQAPKSVEHIDLKAVERDMAETIEKVNATDPTKLQAEIRRLKTELMKKPLVEAAPPEIKEVPIFPAEEIEALTKEIAGFRSDYNEKLERIAKGFEALNGQGTINQIVVAVDKIVSVAKVPVAPVFKPTPKPAHTLQKSVERARNLKSDSIEGDSRISGPQQKLLDTLKLFESFGVPEVRRSNLAAFAGVSPRSSGFEKNLSTLRNHSAGSLVEYLPGSQVALTDVGRSLANEPGIQFAANEDILDAWCRHISNPQEVLLRILFELHPKSIERGDLADKAGVSVLSSGFEKNLSTMRSLGLIDYGPSRTVVATDLMFPFAE